MLFTYMTYSAYELYVALLDALISVAVALSVVVSLDRVFHVVKYAQLKARGRVTGRKPEDYYQFDPLPDPVRSLPTFQTWFLSFFQLANQHSFPSTDRIPVDC